MTGCSAPNCSNQSKTCRMFRFPSKKKDKERWKLWVINCNRYNWEPSDNSRLCKEHFEGREFESGSSNANGVTRLRKDAIPTLFKTSNPLLRTRELLKTIRQERRKPNKCKEKKSGCVFQHNDHEYSMKAERGDHDYAVDGTKTQILVLEPISEGVTLQLVQIGQRTVAENVSTEPRHRAIATIPSLDAMVETSAEKREEATTQQKNKSISLVAARSSESERQLRLLRLELQKTRRKLWRVKKFVAAEKKRNARLTESLQSFIRPDQIAALSKKKANLWSKETLNAAYQLLFACGTRGYKTILSQGFPLPSHRTLLRRVEHVACDPNFVHQFDCPSSCEEEEETENV